MSDCCPVDRCDWTTDVTSVPGGLAGFMVELSKHFSSSQESGDFLLLEHLRTHSYEEWIATINRLRTDLAETYLRML